MNLNVATPWHRSSFDRFLHERLPQLLAQRLPVVGYSAEPSGEHTCAVRISLAAADRIVEVDFAALPQPDAEGRFDRDGRPWVVVPLADGEDLDRAEIRAVGELLYDYVASRLGEAPADLPWDENLVRAWLPLDNWTAGFLRERGQPLDGTNWLSAHTHLRRIYLPSAENETASGHLGRVCPIETPENPNIGRLLTIAVGATVCDGRLIAANEGHGSALGLTASMIPFLEHCEPTRLIMGANMMRQWCPPPAPEPALVQTGNEPAAPDFWCGRNLLTAFVSWGADTHEDAIVLSDSAAARLAYPYPVEPGDKMSVRYGVKGVVGRILPDAEMPHLPDGTPVELIFSYTGILSRLVLGPIREAVMSRVARAQGRPAVVPPFQAPDESALRALLARAGLPEDGMETLTMGRGGQKLERPSTVGWVYWGRLRELAQRKVRTWLAPGGAQRQSDLEYYALRDVRAYETIREQYNTRSSDRQDAVTLAARAAAGPIEHAAPPSPRFADLANRLAAGGIRADLEDGCLLVRFAPPEGETVQLARAVPHPWLPERPLEAVGAYRRTPEYAAVAVANTRLESLIASRAPESLAQKAAADLEERVRRYLRNLLKPEQMRMEARTLFSARAAIAPAARIAYDQVGLPDEIAWRLFGPLAARELGDGGEIETRTERAAAALDAVMDRSWVIVNRPPVVTLTGLVAYKPVRRPENVIRLHPMALVPLNGDYDGDEVAVFLPLTAAGQCEARDLLSIAGHVARDPGLIGSLLPTQAALWGLANMSLSPTGLAEIEGIAGTHVETPEGYLSKASLREAAERLLAAHGIERTLVALDALTWRGFDAARQSGASLSAFVGSSVSCPPAPDPASPSGWRTYSELLGDRIAARTDYDDPDLGPMVLAIKSGARGVLRHAVWYAGSPGVVVGLQGAEAPIAHGLREGLAPDEIFALATATRQGLGRLNREWGHLGRELRESRVTKRFTILARAMRSHRPGAIFAYAAATGEIDPLNDLDSRLFVGLPV